MTDESADQVNELDVDVSQSEGSLTVPEEGEFAWPFRAEMLGEKWTFHRPDPAEIFQHVNQCKIEEGLLDNETLFQNLWEDFVAPHDRPASQRPQLFNLKGSKEKNEAFMFVQSFIKQHFLGQVGGGRDPKPKGNGRFGK